jgi:hypothetical protein
METTHRDTGAASHELEDAQAEQVMDLLEEHVPLSLIMDLSAPEGPHSQEILDAEGVPDDQWWVAP